MQYLIRKTLTWFFIVLGVLSLVIWIFHKEILGYALPSPHKLEFGKIRSELKLNEPVEFLDSENRVIGYSGSGDQLQVYRPLARIAPSLQETVIFLEDAKFFDHNGFDLSEIKQSILDKAQEKKKLRGASTITQQLAKNLFLDRDRSILRKIFEVPWTLRLEEDLSKKQILELYLNLIEWGPGIYGAEAASRHFFDVEANELSFIESLFLALIIPNPVRYDPIGQPKSEAFLDEKRDLVLKRWIQEKRLDPIHSQDILNLRWHVVDPEKLDRRFYPFHWGKYHGNQKVREQEIGFFKKHAAAIWGKKRSSKLRLNLRWPLQLDILHSQVERGLNNAENFKGYIVLLEDRVPRAFRQVAEGEDLTPEFKMEIEKRNYQIERVERLNLAALAYSEL